LMVKPFPEFGGRRNLFIPLIQLRLFFAHTARPKAIHQYSITIIVARSFISAFYYDRFHKNSFIGCERADDAARASSKSASVLWGSKGMIATFWLSNALISEPLCSPVPTLLLNANQ